MQVLHNFFSATIVVPSKLDPSFEQLRENDMKPKVDDNSSKPEEKTAWRRALNSLINVLQIANEHVN
jgi:hypothetical protein